MIIVVPHNGLDFIETSYARVVAHGAFNLVIWLKL